MDTVMKLIWKRLLERVQLPLRVSSTDDVVAFELVQSSPVEFLRTVAVGLVDHLGADVQSDVYTDGVAAFVDHFLLQTLEAMDANMRHWLGSQAVTFGSSCGSFSSGFGSSLLGMAGR